MYCFCFVVKMGNFHFDLVKIVDSHEKSLSLLMVVVKFDFVRINGFE